MATLETIVTYLQMTDPKALVGGAAADPRVAVIEVKNCTVSFYRYLYGEVGRAYHWVERRRWPDSQLAEHLANPAIRIWLLQFEGSPAGYFELYRDPENGVELAYFGLLPEFIGKGLGKHLLTAATETAWSLEPRPTRVWLHTCTLDAPQALPNYLARGFVPYKTDTELIETID